MKTVCIQIGNSDDKLTQKQWHEYYLNVEKIIEIYEGERHFFGGSSTWQLWQNLCWVVVVNDDLIEGFLEKLQGVRESYNQDSVAVLVGDTQFI